MLLMSVLLIAACTPTDSNQPQQQPTSTAVPTAEAAARTTYTVERGDVEDIYEFTGRWLPRDQQDLSFQRAGNVRRVEVSDGDAVSEGELLADLQIEDLENQLASQRLALQSAQRNLESGGNESTDSVVSAQVNLANANLGLQGSRATLPWQSVRDAEVRIDQAERALENAERDYRNALSDPTSPASAVNSAYNTLLQAREDVDSAKRSYTTSVASFYNSQLSIQRSENDYILLQRALEEAQSGGGNPDALQAVQEAQLNIDQTQEKINQSTLSTPFDGVVLNIQISPGDSVEAFSEVMTLAIPDPKEIIADLAFNDIQQLEQGQIGVCQVSGQPETAVQCIVRRIPLSSSAADQSVRIAANFDDLSLDLGRIVQVEMVLEASENTLWLPPQAISTFQNRTFVVLDTPDGTAVRDIEIGLQTDERVEVLSGLDEGDVVVVD